MSRVSSLGPLTSTREPFLVRPFQAGVTGWIVVFGAIIVELAGGALTYSKFVGAALPVLIIPVAVAYGFGIVQWWQVRRAGADPASWAHLGAVVAALLIWFLWPITPGPLDQSTGSASDLCNALPTDHTAACLPRAAQALDASHLSWYLALVLVRRLGPAGPPFPDRGLGRPPGRAGWLPAGRTLPGADPAPLPADRLAQPRPRGRAARYLPVCGVPSGYPDIMLIIPGIEVDEGRLAEICDRYGIAELQIFGSQARGTAGPDSDVDVLYTVRPGRRLGWEIEQLADELSDLFGRRVDLVSLRSLHPLLKPSVLAEARPVYAA